MTEDEAISDVFTILREDTTNGFFSPSEVRGWVRIGMTDVSAISHCCETDLDVYVPLDNATTIFNNLTDGTLSGTARVMVVDFEGTDYYVKVYPTYSGSDGEAAPDAMLTYDNTTLSGNEVLIGFRHGNILYWTMGYSSALALNNGSGDTKQDALYVAPFFVINASTQKVFGLISSSTRYYFQAYRWDDFELHGDGTLASIRMFWYAAILTEDGKFIWTEDGKYVLLTEYDGNAVNWIKIDAVRCDATDEPLLKVHPRQFGWGVWDESYPKWYCDFGDRIWFGPVGGSGFCLKVKAIKTAFVWNDLPDEARSYAVMYALIMAAMKEQAFTRAHILQSAYLYGLLAYRKYLYLTKPDRRCEI